VKSWQAIGCASIALGWLLVGGAAYTRMYVVEAFQVPSASMVPTVLKGDHLFVDKYRFTPIRGDVVVFHYPRDPSIDYIKRVVAVGGDHIVTHPDGSLAINGVDISWSAPDPNCHFDDVQGPCQLVTETVGGRSWKVVLQSSQVSKENQESDVPAGSFFVMGDNRSNSLDSRLFGPVEDKYLVGKADRIWLSAGPNGIRWKRHGPVR
jgi:signal peptidase I